MKSGIATICSYIFMASLTSLAISLFAMVIIVSRHFFVSIDKNEADIGQKFLIVFLISAVIAPISLYINLKYNRIEKLKDEDSF